MRSPFKIEQIEQVVQRLAHEIPRFHRVTSGNVDFDFYYDDNGRPRRVRVTFRRKTGKKAYAGTAWEHDEIECWGFSVEPKDYSTSSDATKISYAYDEDVKKIKEWFRNNMADVKPEPRFSLQQHTSAKE